MQVSEMDTAVVTDDCVLVGVTFLNAPLLWGSGSAHLASFSNVIPPLHWMALLCLSPRSRKSEDRLSNRGPAIIIAAVVVLAV